MSFLLLFSNIKRFWPLCLLLAAGLCIGSQQIRISHLKAKLATASKDLAVQSAYIDQQNSAILEWKKDYDKALAKKESLEKEIKEEHQRSVANAQDILDAKVSQNCEQAVEWGIGWGQKSK